MDLIYIENDNRLELAELQDVDSGAFVNNATVTATLKDTAGLDVAGQSWPLALAYDGQGRGGYGANLDAALALTHGQQCVVHIDAAVAGVVAHWEVPARAVVRT